MVRARGPWGWRPLWQRPFSTYKSPKFYLSFTILVSLILVKYPDKIGPVNSAVPTVPRYRGTSNAPRVSQMAPRMQLVVALLWSTRGTVATSNRTTESRRRLESTIESPKAYLQFLSQLEVVPCRDDLAKLAEKHLRLTGRAAEIGVNKGIFAQKNLGVWSGEYWAIDAWSIGSNTVNLADPAHPRTDIDRIDHAMYNQAKSRISPFGARAKMKRAFSVEAAAEFPVGHFDWIYIDALHTYDAVLEDLRAWWPKCCAA